MTIRLTIKRMLVLTILLAGSIRIVAQVAPFGYVEEPIGVRAIGMGGAGSAHARSGFAFYNPGAAGLLDASMVTVEFGQQWGDLSRGLVETAWVFPSWFVGGAFQSQSNTFSLADETGVLQGSAGVQESMVSLLLGWRREQYTAGFAVNGLEQRILDATGYGVTASGGVTVTVLPEQLFAGLAVTQGGRRSDYYEEKIALTHDTMPTTARVGVAWCDTILGHIPIECVLDGVYSFNYAMVMVPVGIEVKPLPALAVRIGKRFYHPADIISLGIGISLVNATFDAAYVPMNIKGDIDMKWSMGLTYRLARAKSSHVASKDALYAEPVVIRADTVVPVSIAPDSLSPTPDSLPPTPDSLSPTLDSLPPTPDSLPPTPDSLPPTPDSLPPTPDSLPPTPDSLPPTPDSLPPTPDSLPPTPDSLPPTPDSLSPTPDSLSPTPDSLSPTPDSLSPTPESTLPTPESTNGGVSKQ